VGLLLKSVGRVQEINSQLEKTQSKGAERNEKHTLDVSLIMISPDFS
jgi:hypothetical protein